MADSNSTNSCTNPPHPPSSPATERRVSVLFLCTGNSCRSQMAEGWARALRAGVLDAHSAGTHPCGLNPLAVRAMAEAGIDIAGHRSKRPADLGVQFDLVITVCDAAQEQCPTIPGARMVHRAFADPPALAKAAGARSDEEAMPHYRRVRDEIRAFVESLLESPAAPLQAGPPETNLNRACGCAGSIHT